MSSHRSEPASLRAPLVRAWQAAEPGDIVVQRAYGRFLQRRSPRPRRHRVAVLAWVALGMLLGMGSLSAASAIARYRLQLRATVVAPPARPMQMPAPPRPAAPDASTQPAGSALPASEARSPSTRPSAAVEPPLAPRDSWQRAADGLRDHDFDAANDALLELSARGTGEERDEAQLVRAQLLLNRRATQRALELLSPLRGSSSLSVRRKADELWQRASASVDSHRSFPALDHTQ